MGKMRRASAWLVVTVLAVLFASFVIPAHAEMRLVLLGFDYQPENDRTTYYYELYVGSSTDLQAAESSLVMSGMDGVLAQGNANYWVNAGVTSTTAAWSYVKQAPFTLYGTFDVIADSSNTEPGEVNYCVEGPTGNCGTVEGPVPVTPDPTYCISGTVYLDADRSGGLFDGPESTGGPDEILPDVEVQLLDVDGNVIATTVSNNVITGPEGEYIGNYRFGDLAPGDYTVAVQTTVTTPDGQLLPTTVTEQSVTIVDAPVRQIDFGYAPELLYTISGTTFVDYNRDGVWDQPAEEALEGVGLIQLVDGDGNVVAETFSTFESIYDGSGNYLGNYIFEDVPAGSYTVVAPATAGELGTLELTSVGQKSADVVDTSVTGVDFGYLDPDYTAPAEVEVEANVFFDYNQNGVFDDFEMPFDGIGVTLGGDADQTEYTGADGNAGFGEQINGDYTLSVTDGGAYGLLEYWTTTTPATYQFTIDSTTESPVVRDFGFYPDESEIITDIRNGEITGNNHTIGFWKHNVTRALMNSSKGIQVPREDLLGYLDELESYGPCDDPYQFGDDPLWKALWYLHPGLSGNSPVAKLDRQLLAAELNQVSGFNSSMPELEEAILWYAEWVRNFDQDNAGALASFIDVMNNIGNM